MLVILAQGVSVQGVNVLGGKCPGGKCPGATCPGGGGYVLEPSYLECGNWNVIVVFLS